PSRTGARSHRGHRPRARARRRASTRRTTGTPKMPTRRAPPRRSRLEQLLEGAPIALLVSTERQLPHLRRASRREGASAPGQRGPDGQRRLPAGDQLEPLEEAEAQDRLAQECPRRGTTGLWRELRLFAERAPAEHEM